VPVDNELEEVITLNAESADDNTEAADRGDNFTGDEPADAPADEAVDLDALKAVAEADPEPKAVEEEHKTEARIPKARFDEVNARMKQAEAEKQALEEQLRALQAPKGQPAQAAQEPGQVDLNAAEDAYLEALRQGDASTAKQIRVAINAHIQQQAENAAIEKVTATLSKRETETSLVAIANDSIKKYPFLNQDSDDANDAAINEVVEWRDYYASKGMRADVALQKAVEKIAPMYAPKAAPKAEPEPEPKVDLRGKEAIQRNAQAAAAQPMQLNGVGERAAKARHDVAKMTEEEFDALPASEKKRLRGDA
jgi:hypothetical protein